MEFSVDTEYDWAKVPPYNGNDPLPVPGSLKALLLPPLLNKAHNKGTQGVQARYGAELPPIISIVRHPGRPVILGMDSWKRGKGPHPHTFSLTKKIACFTRGQLRPYY